MEKEIQEDRSKEERETSKRGRRPSEIPVFPRNSLKSSLRVAQSIEDNNAGRPYDRLDLAKSVDYSPNSSGFRTLLISSARYGLTTGGYQADKIALTDLGKCIVSPPDITKLNACLRQALLFPELLNNVYSYYDKKKLPRDDLLKETLKKEFKVLPTEAEDCHRVIRQNIEDYDLLNIIKDNEFLQLDKLSSEQSNERLGELEASQTITDDVPEKEVNAINSTPVLQIPKQIFLAHGRNKIPLEQLKTILNQFKVPFQVATDEPHMGRAISKKVTELMKNCTSGIFIFTADEETTDERGMTVLRPSDNVVFELGAGTIRYEDKIVIFREKGVSFGSNFTDYGHITFEKDKLNEKAFELMKELIGLGFLQVTPT